jgi:hypothetical protein
LIGRYETLREADRAILFIDSKGEATTEPPALRWAEQRRANGTRRD